jgi:branched-chain amino acid transport system permease protein
MSSSALYLQALLSGLLIGGAYALMAQGLSLIFGVLKVINFAHGAFMMLGMYLAYWLFTLLGIDPFLASFMSIPVFFVFGYLVQTALVGRVIEASHDAQLMLTVGLAIIFENVATLLWTPDFRTIQVSYAATSMNLGGVVITYQRLATFGLAMLVTGLLYLLLHHTELGRRIRATAQDREGAQLIGINAWQVYAIAFGIGTAVLGAAGGLIAPLLYTHPTVGGFFTITAFVVVVLGGIGDFWGALLGGLAIGAAEGLGAVFLSGSMKQLVTFAIFVLTLMFRPQGLFGVDERRG